MFTVTNLTKEFKIEKHSITVLNDINFTVKQGEWVSLTGASGCGKTTLLHLLGGLAKPTKGQIIYKDFKYSRMGTAALSKMRLKEIGFVFQAFNLFPELNALENVILPSMVGGTNPRLGREKAEELLEKVGLSHRLTHRPAELSGGEQQRIAIARALMNDPQTILADEPTGNLDDENSSEVIQIFEDLHKKHNKTIVMVTHQSSLAKRADRMLWLHEGQITPK